MRDAAAREHSGQGLRVPAAGGCWPPRTLLTPPLSSVECRTNAHRPFVPRRTSQDPPLDPMYISGARDADRAISRTTASIPSKPTTASNLSSPSPAQLNPSQSCSTSVLERSMFAFSAHANTPFAAAARDACTRLLSRPSTSAPTYRETSPGYVSTITVLSRPRSSSSAPSNGQRSTRPVAHAGGSVRRRPNVRTTSWSSSSSMT